MVNVNSADTVTAVEGLSAAPYLRTWADSDTTEGVVMTQEWTKPLSWLLGYTKPMFYGLYKGSAYSLNHPKPTPIPLDTELIKRGGITHTLGQSRVTIPEEGWYTGHFSLGTAGSTGVYFVPQVMVNGVTVATFRQRFTIDFAGGCPFAVKLKAGDYVELGCDGDYTSVETTDPAYPAALFIMWDTVGGA